jgi:crotonobetainyl-CoA:carnitine CoA-transferase CaiB-like acyl-CoA transferase
VSEGPLAGVRLLSIALNVPGPVAVARLVAAGARADKVEPPAGDALAGMCPAWYEQLHRGVDVRRLDLKSEAGRGAFWDLAKRADVLITGQRPGALARLGIDHASSSRRLPLLRRVAIVGHTANPEEAGHDLTYLADAGLLSVGMPVTMMADLFGAQRACEAVLLVLREVPGSQRVVGLRDSLDGLQDPMRYGVTVPGGPLGGGNPAYGVYNTRAGRVAVAALEPHFRARLYQGLGLPDGSPIDAALAARTAGEWEQWARTRDVPLGAVRDADGNVAGAPPTDEDRSRSAGITNHPIDRDLSGHQITQ